MVPVGSQQEINLEVERNRPSESHPIRSRVADVPGRPNPEGSVLRYAAQNMEVN